MILRYDTDRHLIHYFLSFFLSLPHSRTPYKVTRNTEDISKGQKLDQLQASVNHSSYVLTAADRIVFRIQLPCEVDRDLDLQVFTSPPWGQ